MLTTSNGELSGVLTVPSGKGKGIVALIIAGSGPTDRNGNNPSMQNNCLKMLSAELAKSGIASLRYDKRGIAASAAAMKQEADLRFEDYVNDARGWIETLKKDNRFSQVVVIGHSEGSLIGMLAAERANKMISISGLGQPAHAVLKDQLQSQPQQVQDMTYPLLDSLKQGHRVTNPSPMLASLFRESVQPYLISWFAYEPQAEIRKLKIPVLIVQGTTDLQVSVAEARLLSAANPNAKLVIIDSMNHVLKSAPAEAKENLKAYNDPALPLVPQLVEAITRFIVSSEG
jgi:alpha-beta hydrolase superfamily lysophospholipase